MWKERIEKRTNEQTRWKKRKKKKKGKWKKEKKSQELGKSWIMKKGRQSGSRGN